MDVMVLIQKKHPLLAETMEDHRSIGDSCHAATTGSSESRNDLDATDDVDDPRGDDPDAGKDSMQIDGETLQMAGFGIPGVDF